MLDLFKRFIDFPDIRQLDFYLVSLILLTTIFGLVAVATSSIYFSDTLTGDPFYFFYKQLFHFFLGLIVAFFILCLPLQIWENYDRHLLLLGILGLSLVFFPGIGVEVKGSNRWINLFGFTLQPSEIMKFVLLVYVSAHSVRRIQDLQSNWFGFLRPAILIVLVISLILIQPDLGTPVVIFSSVLAVLFLAGVNIKQFLLVIFLGVLSIFALIFFEPYRWQRIISFLDPWADASDTGYQLTQSLMAISRGDWFGVGLGEGMWKMGHLPDAHTDFIFSVIIEEMGLLTSFFLLLLIFGIVIRLIQIGNRALEKKHFFGYFFSYGSSVLIGLQTIINVGVSTGMLPTKGLTLPFVSYGGTNLLVLYALIGLVLRSDYETKTSMPLLNINRRVRF
ncbi:MAG: putative lipid II flippase FtsW [Gammaproteobacteria bacterium]